MANNGVTGRSWVDSIINAGNQTLAQPLVGFSNLANSGVNSILNTASGVVTGMASNLANSMTNTVSSVVGSSISNIGNSIMGTTSNAIMGSISQISGIISGNLANELTQTGTSLLSANVTNTLNNTINAGINGLTSSIIGGAAGMISSAFSNLTYTATMAIYHKFGITMKGVYLPDLLGTRSNEIQYRAREITIATRSAIRDAIITNLNDQPTPYHSPYYSNRVLTIGQRKFSSRERLPNLPKPKGLFFVYFGLNPNLSTETKVKKELLEYISKNGGNYYSNDELREADYLAMLSGELSRFVKKAVKPSFDFETSKLNQYNQRRLIYKKTKDISGLSITFYNVKENPVQQFFFNYLKYISNDYFCKSYDRWTSESNPFKKWESNDINTINPFGLTTHSNFRMIDRISIIEYYMNKFMVYTYENPILTNFAVGDNEVGSFDEQDITVKFDCEGFDNDLIDISEISENNTIDKWNFKNNVGDTMYYALANFMNVRFSASSYTEQYDYSHIKSTPNIEKNSAYSTNLKNMIYRDYVPYSLKTMDKLLEAVEEKNESFMDIIKNGAEQISSGSFIQSAVDSVSSAVNNVTSSIPNMLSNIPNPFQNK